jgi:hypothetical protein
MRRSKAVVINMWQILCNLACFVVKLFDGMVATTDDSISTRGYTEHRALCVCMAVIKGTSLRRSDGEWRCYR